MIAVHGETLWSPAPQPMDGDDGCETWNITTLLEQKLVTAQHTMERKNVHSTLHDKVKNSVIRSKTKVKDILEKKKGGKMEMGRAPSKKRG